MEKTVKQIVSEMDESIYRSKIGLSGTGCAAIAISPAHYRATLTAPRKETPAMLLGTAAHALILEGVEAFRARFAAVEIDRRTKAGKEEAAAIEAEGRRIIDPEDAQACEAMAAAIRRHPVASSLIHSPGESELSIFATDPETGLPMKGRIDRLPDSGGYLVDLKTTADAMRWNPGDYLIQVCHYLEILAALRFDRVTAAVFVVVETSPPHTVRCIAFDADALAHGRAKVRTAWDTYARCVADGEWPGIDRGLEVVSLKPWERT